MLSFQRLASYPKQDASHFGSVLPRRVLSIDMGIKNFSYALIDVHDLSKPPCLQQWRRLDVTTDFCSQNEDIDFAEKEKSFDPLKYARISYLLFAKYILPTYRPDIILIERQRHRTGGRSTVIEWTFRVNMFESVVWGVLNTYISENGFNVYMKSISPRTTKSYWIPSPLHLGVEEPNEKISYAKSKSMCVQIVKDWVSKDPVSETPVVTFSKNVSQQVARFHGKKKKVCTTRKVENGEAVLETGVATPNASVKLDDLTDSLLQGIAWVQWQRNQNLVVDAINDGKDLQALTDQMMDSHLRDIQFSKSVSGRNDRKENDSIASLPLMKISKVLLT